MKTRLLMLLLVLTSGVANAAEMYKCTKNGHGSYQDRPCDATSRQTKVQASQAKSMVGCYVAKFAGFDNGSSGSSERFEIRASATSGFELQFQGGVVPLKIATPDEVREVSKGLHVHFKDGVSMKWPQGTPNQKPVGVYEGRGEDGRQLIFAFFFMSNGPATKVACR